MNTKLNRQLITSSLAVTEIIFCLFVGNIASANPSDTQLDTESPEIELSPEGAKILCERFPLNSRCQEGSADNSTPSESSSSSTTETEATPLPTDITSPTVPGGVDPNAPSSLPGEPTTPGSLPGRPTTFPRTP